jgi:molybdenum cofactor biosynthesis enzyme MoaA
VTEDCPPSGSGLAPWPPYCGGCGEGTVNNTCQGSLLRQGIRKAHWECWSECNLACPFCFRTSSRPLDTRQAVLMLRALATGAARAIVFAGGDPSLRRDLAELVTESVALGLAVQVQTNGQHVSRSFLSALRGCEYVGLSIDGPDAATHDGFRNKSGNFKQVVKLLGQLEALGIPVSVRTVVAHANHQTVPEMSQLIVSYSNVICWKLLEFTAVGNGFVNQDNYALSSDEFERTVLTARQRLGASAAVLEVLRNTEKVGIYMMISAEGVVYGITKTALMRTGQHHYVGSMLSEHLVHLSERLPFSAQRRADRRVPVSLHLERNAFPSAG